MQIRYDEYPRADLIEDLKTCPAVMTSHLLNYLWAKGRVSDLMELGYKVPDRLEAFLNEPPVSEKQNLLWIYYLKIGDSRCVTSIILYVAPPGMCFIMLTWWYSCLL